MNKFKFLCFAAVAVVFASPTNANGLLFDSTSSAPNLPSLGYEATSTSESGSIVQIGPNGTMYALNTIGIDFSVWSEQSQWPSFSGGFNTLVTVSFYDIDASGNATSLIGSVQGDPFFTFRPEASSSCTGSSAGGYMAGGQCYNGALELQTFNLNGLVVPNVVGVTVAFNTTDYGASPLGTPNPDDSLNLGLLTTNPAVGSDPFPGTLLWNTSYQPFYSNPACPGGTLCTDTDWSPYTSAFSISGSQSTTTPEPGSLILTGAGALSLWAGVRRKRRGR